MPELPEVETVRRDLRQAVGNKKIIGVKVRSSKIVRGQPALFKRHLLGSRIVEYGRRGKLLMAKLDSGRYWLTHMKMTGQLIYTDGKHAIAGGHPDPVPAEGGDLSEAVPHKHTHVIVRFEGGGFLFFNDLRKFGYMDIADEKRMRDVLEKFGVEPLADDFTPEVLRGALANRKVALKSVLLEQKRIAGLGNIYVDEACFAAGIRPGRRADKVNKEEIKKLHSAIRRILKKAIEMRGTTFGTYRDGWGRKGNYVRLLKVYQRTGERCRRCGQGNITRIKISGRGTHYCSICQK